MINSTVSVIVSCYNQAQYLSECLESVIRQTYNNWECIIVNDGSTDDSEKIIQRYTSKDSRFVYLFIKNSGVCVARNIAINHSKGRYLFSLDSDNYFHPECLKKCINVFNESKNTKLVYTEAQLIGNNSGLWHLPQYTYATILRYNMIDNSAMFLREDFDRVGGYRTNMVNSLEDWDFWVALLAPYTDDQVIKINEPLYYYRTTATSRNAMLIAQGKYSLMTDNIVFNNYKIYQKIYPDILYRILKYDYYNVMMNKPLVRIVVKLHNKLHRIKSLMKKLLYTKRLTCR